VRSPRRTPSCGDQFSIDVGNGARTVNVTARAAAFYNTGTGAADLRTDLSNAIKGALALAGDNPDDVDVSVTGGQSAIDPFNVSLIGHNGATLVLANVTNTPATVLGLIGGTSTYTPPSGGAGGVFQVGSGVTANDKINVVIDDVSSTGLGVDSSVVDVALNSSTVNINAIDLAITQVSTLRGNLGAYQNRFEHTINNLSITTENLSASESRIRDTDMAAEMMSFTRAQILQQAGTAMLAQANAVPQSVLQLLK